jgi:hypothetical protein
MRLARLAPSDIDDMRRGRGNYQDRLELRRLLAEIDPTLRTRRNSERMTLANLAARLAQLDTRTGDPSRLQAPIEASRQRLTVLDAAVVKASVGHIGGFLQARHHGHEHSRLCEVAGLPSGDCATRRRQRRHRARRRAQG